MSHLRETLQELLPCFFLNIFFCLIASVPKPKFQSNTKIRSLPPQLLSHTPCCCHYHLSLTTLSPAGAVVPLVQTMPAELVPFSLFATRNASQPYLLFVFSLHHWLAFWTFLNAHSLQQVVHGDLLLKLLFLFLCQNGQAPNIDVIPFLVTMSRWLVLANVRTRKLPFSFGQDAAAI